MPLCSLAPVRSSRSLQASFVCDYLARRKSAISVGFRFLLKLFTLGENGVISTKSSSPGQTEWSGLCAKMLTTSWFSFKPADMQFVDKNLPKKLASGSNPPELLRLWQKSQRPPKHSTGGVYTTALKRTWNVLLRLISPLSPCVLIFKRDQNSIFPEERECRFTDFITDLRQIEQKIRGNVFFIRGKDSF